LDLGLVTVIVYLELNVGTLLL